MKKLLFAFIIVFLISFIVACSNEETTANQNVLTTDDEIEEPLTIKKLRIGTTDNNSPFMIMEEGHVTGLFVDIMSSVLDKLGYEYEFVILPWSRLLNGIETGEVDIAFPFYDTPERRQFVNYSEEPIGFSQITAITMHDSDVTFDGSMASLSDYRIGIVQDFFYTRTFEDAVNEKIILVDEAITIEKNIEKLLQGRVDLIFEDIAVVKEYLKTHSIASELKFLEPPLTNSYHHVVFSKKQNLTKIRQEVDEQLKAMKSDDSLFDIFTEYDMTYYGDLFKLQEQMNPSPDKFFQDDSNSPLSVGILGDTKPYAYYENDQLTGFGVDYITEVLTRIGVEFELVDLPFSRMLEELKSGSLDIGTDLYLKPEREEYAEYPELPYAGYPTVLFKKTTTAFDYTGNLDELKLYSIGYIRGYSLGPLDEYKDDVEYDFAITDSPEQNIENLVNDRVDLIIDIKSTGESFIDKMNLSEDIVAVEPPIFYDYSYVVFSKKNNLDKLVTEYVLTVQAMYEDGTIEMLSEKYNLPYLEFDEFN